MPKGRVGLDQRVREMALRFAEEVARVVRAEIGDEVAARIGDVLRAAARSSALQLDLGAGPGDRRIGKRPVPVACPVAGCAEPGVRAKNNFCAAHAAALSAGEKRRLRAAPARVGRRR